MTLSRRAFIAGTGVAIAAPALAHERLHEVAIRDFAFVPERLVVQPTDRIRFTNHDLAPHTATAEDGSWDTGEMARGDSVTLTVDAAWGAAFFCAFHPAMTGALSIEDH